MIILRDVHKVYPTRFGEKLVLDGIGFDLNMGERLGVLGRNGAGKSTMIRLISGAEMPTSGTIERHMSVSWPLAFGGAFQHMLTGVDNIQFISRIYDQDFERNLAFVEEFAELGPYLREPVRTYSSGMRARLAFAISMIIEFDCFLIDEIGAVGDARVNDEEQFGERLRRLREARVCIRHYLQGRLSSPTDPSITTLCGGVGRFIGTSSAMATLRHATQRAVAAHRRDHRPGGRVVDDALRRSV